MRRLLSLRWSRGSGYLDDDHQRAGTIAVPISE